MPSFLAYRPGLMSHLGSILIQIVPGGRPEFSFFFEFFFWSPKWPKMVPPGPGGPWGAFLGPFGALGGPGGPGGPGPPLGPRGRGKPPRQLWKKSLWRPPADPALPAPSGPFRRPPAASGALPAGLRRPTEARKVGPGTKSWTLASSPPVRRRASRAMDVNLGSELWQFVIAYGNSLLRKAIRYW